MPASSCVGNVSWSGSIRFGIISRLIGAVEFVVKQMYTGVSASILSTLEVCEDISAVVGQDGPSVKEFTLLVQVHDQYLEIFR